MKLQCGETKAERKEEKNEPRERCFGGRMVPDWSSPEKVVTGRCLGREEGRRRKRMNKIKTRCPPF